MPVKRGRWRRRREEEGLTYEEAREQSVVTVHVVIQEEVNQPDFVRRVSEMVPEEWKEGMRIRVFVKGFEPGEGMGLVDAQTAWRER